MGLPIRHRKKYISHKKRWDKRTIEDEKVLTTDYALKNKKEIRKVEFEVAKFKKLAKDLNSKYQGEKSEEIELFLGRLKALGYLQESSESLDDVLDISLRDILERRLSNIVYKMKYARTPSQARQFVTHRHIKVNGKVIESPSYPVSLALEKTIEFVGTSALSDEEHPERKMQEEVTLQEELAENEERAKDAPSQAPDMDKVEEKLDDEEQDEVKEEE